MSDQEKHTITIEELGEEFSGRLVGRMVTGKEPKYSFIAIKDEKILKWPRLTLDRAIGFGRKPFDGDLRVNRETGALATTRWAELKTTYDPETGARTVNDPEDLTFISVGNMDHDPEDLPKEGRAVRLVASEVWDGLETAIRQQHHILERRDLRDLNSEPRQLQEIFQWIDQTAKKFREGPVTEQNLVQWAQEAEELMTQAGLDRAVDSTKKKLADMLTKAPEEDRLGRVNPLVSRIRLRSALLAATRRAMTGAFTDLKFSSNLNTLLATRKYTRNVLEDAAEQLYCRLQQLEGHEQGWADKVQATATWELAAPQVAPYLQPARLAAILLVGCRDSKKDLNRKVLGDETAEQVFSMEPATTLLKKGETYSAARQISWAREMLHQALDDNSEINPLKQI